MLSGWNCTPYIGSSLWRTPMTAGKDAPFVVRYSRGLAVHAFGCVTDLSAEILNYHLMSQAHAENGQFVFEMLHGGK